jgi:hypothetical protein
MTTLARHLGDVVKTARPASTDPYFAAMPADAATVRRYAQMMEAAGVPLPGGLSVTDGASGAEVRYAWVLGPTLLELPGWRSAEFLAAVTSVAGWVRALEQSGARLDANLANFVIPDGGCVTCIDVLPPLLADHRPPEPGPWEQVIGGLCFDTDITLCALAGYAARHLLSGPGRAGVGAIAAALRTCPGHQQPGHQRPARLAARWFHSRLEAVELAAAGHVTAAEAQRLLAATSVRALQAAPAGAREQHADAALAIMASALNRRTS